MLTFIVFVSVFSHVHALMDIRYPSLCSVVSSGDVLDVDLRFDDDLPSGSTLLLGIQSSGLSAFHYDIPPTPYNKVWTLCADQTLLEGLAQCGNSRDVRFPKSLVVSLPVTLDDDSYYELYVKASDLSVPLASTLFTTQSQQTRHFADLEKQMRQKHRVKQVYVDERAAKREKIDLLYQPNDVELSSLPLKDVITEELFEAIESGQRSTILALATIEDAFGVSSIPLFRPEFAERLLKEIEFIEKTQKSEMEGGLIERPNSMNNYGIVIDDWKLKSLFNRLVKQAIEPLFKVLFPEFLSFATLDSHHAFVVEYALNKDKDLDVHMDESLITVNVNLGRKFEGGAVVFSGVRNTPSEHNEEVALQQRIGGREALLHPGQTWHRADPLLSGERFNLIIWTRSFASMQSPAEKFVCHCQADQINDWDEICFQPKEKVESDKLHREL